MTQKYESVLSDADVLEVAIEHAKSCGESRGKAIQILEKDPVSKGLFFAVIRLAEQATLSKLQPQLEAIGAGGVSGERITGRGENKELRIVFHGAMPDLRFIEVENEKGESVNIGKWRSRTDGYVELVINSALPEPSND